MRMAKEELRRIDKQRNLLGSKGLAKKEKELADAMQQNEVLPPVDVLLKIPIPSADSIEFHKVTNYKSNTNETPVGFQIKDLPCYAEAFDIQTNFVYVSYSRMHDKLNE